MSGAFKAPCIYCKQDVWWFRCSCHSKAQFNELGKPWLKHDCSDEQLSVLQERAKRQYGRFKLIKPAEIVAKRERKLGIPTALEKPKSVRKKANKQRRKRAKAIRKLFDF